MLRLLHASQFNHKKTFHNIEHQILWRAENIPVKISDSVENMIKSGFMYVHGRDRNFRPLIVIRPRIVTEIGITDPNDGIMACVFMMEYVRANLFLPG